jgi:DNA-binding transcriptional regulator YdaS (Cro superfamily)
MAETETPLERAIRLADGMTALARKLQERGKKITGHATIYQWKQSRIPADYCPDIEALTGVTCEELRPDVNWAVLRGTVKAWTGSDRRKPAKA